MVKKDTANFLRFMNETNEAIVARQAEEEVQKQVGMDPIRVQRDTERRKTGTLRAREHRSKRPTPARNVFGYTKLS